MTENKREAFIVRTPVRISFLGGGTDYPAYFRAHGGATLVTTIDKYTYVTIRPLPELHKQELHIHYDQQVERVDALDAIEHPAVRECLRFLDIQSGLAISLSSDLPVRAGLGSSSSLTVGLLKALHAYKQEWVTAEQVAREAVYVEQVLIKERVGCQDQYACAHGGMLHLKFGTDDKIQVIPMVLSTRHRLDLAQCLMLFDTGIRRMAHDVLDEQFVRMKTSEIDDELAALAHLVDQGLDIFNHAPSLANFGALLHEGWQLKRRFSCKVSNPCIDEYYARARWAGAAGGKLLGAGGGGFLLLFGEPAAQPQIRQALAGLTEVKFKLDNTGSEIMAGWQGEPCLQR